MKLDNVGNNKWLLHGIKENRESISDGDLFVKNLSGTPSLKHPEYTPEHVILLFIEDDELRYILDNELHMFCKEVEYTKKDENGDETDKVIKHQYKFKAYPGNVMRFDPITREKKPLLDANGKPRETPVVFLKERKLDGTFRNERLQLNDIGRIDHTAIADMAIKFHLFPNSYHPGLNIAAIDEIWAIADQDAKVLNEQRIRERYFNNDDDSDRVTEEEATPF